VSTKKSIHRAFAAFALLLVLIPSRPLSAQSDTPAEFEPKSEAQARTWSDLVPGGGQFYAGKPVKGLILLGITVGAAASVLSCDDHGELGGCLPIGVLGFVVSATSWGVGRITAAGDAREYNEKHSRRTAIEPVLDRHAGRVGLGLALRY